METMKKSGCAFPARAGMNRSTRRRYRWLPCVPRTRRDEPQYRLTRCPDGVAAQQGLEQGDVILNVNGSAVSSPSQVRQALADAKSQGKHDVLMKVKARKSTVFVAIPLAQS
jgi:C-terminal processing protease CtpA/Prc